MPTIGDKLEVSCITVSLQDGIGYGFSVIFDFLLSQKTWNVLIGLIFSIQALVVTRCKSLRFCRGYQQWWRGVSFLFCTLIPFVFLICPSREVFPCGSYFMEKLLRFCSLEQSNRSKAYRDPPRTCKVQRTHASLQAHPLNNYNSP